MTSFHPLAASLDATSFSSSTLLPSSTESIALGSLRPASTRVRTGGAVDIRPLPEAKRPRSSNAHRHPSLTRRSPVPTSSAGHGHAHAMLRPAAVSTSAQDWVNAALPPTPALQTCTFDHARSSSAAAAAATWNGPTAQEEAPPAPVLDSRLAHCPTPELTPPEEEARGLSASASSSSNAKTFIRRDDLTAKAIARAASINMPAQPPASSSSSSGTGTSSQSTCDKDRFVNGLVGKDRSLYSMTSARESASWHRAPRKRLTFAKLEAKNTVTSRLLCPTAPFAILLQVLPFSQSSRSGARRSSRRPIATWPCAPEARASSRSRTLSKRSCVARAPRARRSNLRCTTSTSLVAGSARPSRARKRLGTRLSVSNRNWPSASVELPQRRRIRTLRRRSRRASIIKLKLSRRHTLSTPRLSPLNSASASRLSSRLRTRPSCAVAGCSSRR